MTIKSNPNGHKSPNLVTLVMAEQKVKLSRKRGRRRYLPMSAQSHTFAHSEEVKHFQIKKESERRKVVGVCASVCVRESE